MKNTMVVLISLVVSITAFAADFELDKGAIEIDGSFQFSSMTGDLYENSDGDGITLFSLSPNGFYFVSPGFGIGGAFVYSSRSQGDYSISSVGIGPAVIYYFGNSSTKTWPFLTGAFLYQSSKSKDTWMGETDETTISGTTIHFAGGIAHKVVDHFILKGGIFYDIDSQKGDWEDAESESGSKFGILIGFTGFIY